jgi:hypothetical protein
VQISHNRQYFLANPTSNVTAKSSRARFRFSIGGWNLFGAPVHGMLEISDHDRSVTRLVALLPHPEACNRGSASENHINGVSTLRAIFVAFARRQPVPIVPIAAHNTVPAVRGEAGLNKSETRLSALADDVHKAVDSADATRKFKIWKQKLQECDHRSGNRSNPK